MHPVRVVLVILMCHTNSVKSALCFESMDSYFIEIILVFIKISFYSKSLDLCFDKLFHKVKQKVTVYEYSHELSSVGSSPS